MTQKVSKSKAVDQSTTQAVTENKNSKVWSYIRYFYQQNEALWTRVAELERSNVELRKSLKGGF